MKSFYIVTNRLKDPNGEFTSAVVDILHQKGCEVLDNPDGDYDCIIALGGDGTVLSTIRTIKKSSDVPIVGINLGHLGFMSSVESDEVGRAIDALISGEFYIERRMMIEATVKQSKRCLGDVSFTALNDVVINRRGIARMITSNVYVNNSLVNAYFADGVIVSTPTGSTGYNLSAGGPIVTPEAELMLITPICPHSLNMRSVVVSDKDTISIDVDMSRDLEPENAILAVDGQQVMEFSQKDTVVIKKSNRSVGLVRFKDKNFFKLLYMKLGDQTV